MAKAKKKEATEWMYEIIEAPHVTEKATLGSEHGQVTFIVAMTQQSLRSKKLLKFCLV